MTLTPALPVWFVMNRTWEGEGEGKLHNLPECYKIKPDHLTPD